MFVTSIEPLAFSKKKDRMRVRLQGGADFVLYKKEIDRYGIGVEEEIAPEVYERLLSEVFIPRARSRALHLLEKQDRTKEDLRRKLCDSGYPPEAVESAIAYVLEYSYIDDLRYASNYIRYNREKKSRSRIFFDLERKGISKELTEEAAGLLALDGLDPVFDDLSLISSYIEKKYREDMPPKDKKKIMDHLLRAGFAYGDISEVVKLFGK